MQNNAIETQLYW